MIDQLRLYNFKCFEEQTLDFGNLTLLSGLNGMGKSSVMQSLLLLRQSYQQGLLQNIGLALNGDLVRLGTASDALYEGASSTLPALGVASEAEEDQLGFDLAMDDQVRARWRFNYNQQADVMDLTSVPVSPAIFDTSIFGDDFQYLQAERIGPRTSFEMSDYQVRQHRQLGPRGEFTAHFLALFGSSDLPNTELQHPAAVSPALIHQVEAWIGEVSPGTRIKLAANLDMDLVSLRYAFVTPTGESNPFRATNVGFGLTYTLPILVAALAARPGTLLLIENPEAHLHPKGQALMGDLLARVASRGVQIVIETHSDHVLNGIRLAAHDGRIDPDRVRLHYFQREPMFGQASVVSPRLDRDGRIDRWPEGFFDEWEKSLDALLEPRSE